MWGARCSLCPQTAGPEGPPATRSCSHRETEAQGVAFDRGQPCCPGAGSGRHRGFALSRVSPALGPICGCSEQTLPGARRCPRGQQCTRQGHTRSLGLGTPPPSPTLCGVLALPGPQAVGDRSGMQVPCDPSLHVCSRSGGSSGRGLAPAPGPRGEHLRIEPGPDSGGTAAGPEGVPDPHPGRGDGQEEVCGSSWPAPLSPHGATRGKSPLQSTRGAEGGGSSPGPVVPRRFPGFGRRSSELRLGGARLRRAHPASGRFWNKAWSTKHTVDLLLLGTSPCGRQRPGR